MFANNLLVQLGLERLRAKCLAVIYDKMMNTRTMMEPWDSERKVCDPTALGHFINALVIEKIWPKKSDFEGVGIGEIFRRVPFLSERLAVANCSMEGSASGCDHENHELRFWTEELVRECKSLKDSLAGRLGKFYSQYECLDCLKSSGSHKRGHDGNKKHECRIKHQHT